MTHEAMGVSDKGYSQVTTIRADEAGRFVFVSGQVSRDEAGNVVGEGDFETQCRYVFDQLSKQLEAAGCDITKVLKVTVFLANFDHYSTLVRLRKDIFSPDSPPASTAVAVDSLVNPELLLEIEAIAFAL